MPCIAIWFVMAWPEKTWFFADCSMNIAPDAAALAEIGLATARSTRAFGHEPRMVPLACHRVSCMIEFFVGRTEADS